MPERRGRLPVDGINLIGRGAVDGESAEGVHGGPVTRVARGPGVYFKVVIGDDGAGQRPQLVTLSEEDDMARLGLIAAFIGWGCGTSGDKTDGDTAGGPDGGWRPDLVCPGDAGCVSGEGALEAGGGALHLP